MVYREKGIFKYINKCLFLLGTTVFKTICGFLTKLSWAKDIHLCHLYKSLVSHLTLWFEVCFWIGLIDLVDWFPFPSEWFIIFPVFTPNLRACLKSFSIFFFNFSPTLGTRWWDEIAWWDSLSILRNPPPCNPMRTFPLFLARTLPLRHFRFPLATAFH